MEGSDPPEESPNRRDSVESCDQISRDWDHYYDWLLSDDDFSVPQTSRSSWGSSSPEWNALQGQKPCSKLNSLASGNDSILSINRPFYSRPYYLRVDGTPVGSEKLRERTYFFVAPWRERLWSTRRSNCCKLGC